jgi:preprotein translocase subunit SecB
MQNQENQIFKIERIYLKNSAFESIDTPHLFKKQGQLSHMVEMHINHMYLPEEDFFEVVLTLTVTGKIDDEAIFKAKAEQAGVFAVKGFPEEHKDRVLRIYCANLLYPYARHIIAELTMQGSFPAISLAPINFEVVYDQQKTAKAGDASTKH